MGEDISQQGKTILLHGLRALHRDMPHEFKMNVEKLSVWGVTIPSIAYKESFPTLFEELEEHKLVHQTTDSGIALELQFPYTFPTDPPMVRVLRPRFQYMTGHVTIGGSLCAQFLTSSGWTSKMPMDLLLLSVRNLFIDGKAQVAIHPSMHHPMPRLDYTNEEAVVAFKRAVETHGWGVQALGKKKRT